MSIARRPLLGALSLLPLVGAGAVALSSRGTPGLGEIVRPQSVAAPGALTLHAEGPLTVPAEILEAGGGDAEFAVVPPSPAIGVGAVALEEDSSLLFGRVSTSTTLQDEDGNPLAPSISVTDEDGAETAAEPTSLGLGALALAVPEIPGAPVAVLAAADGGLPVADAVQSTHTDTGDFRSLSLTRMLTPVVDASFLGMGTQPGTTSVLVLRNVSSRPATAAVQVWTPDGPAQMQGRSQIVVAAGAEQQLLLDTVAAGQQAVGLRVVTVGAPLLMHVSTAERDGLTPRGAQILSPLPPAASSQMIPGVHVSAAEEPPLLVLQNPGGTGAAADVTVLGPAGALPLAGLGGLELPAGTVLGVPLPITAPGDYVVRVEADAPLDAVVRSRAPGARLPGDTLGVQADLAIAGPAPALSAGAVLALPALGPFGLLALAATEDTSATVIPVGVDGGAGDVIQRDVPAGRIVTVPATELTGTTGTPAGLAITAGAARALHATWVQVEHDPALGPLLSTCTVAPARRDAGSLAVQVR